MVLCTHVTLSDREVSCATAALQSRNTESRQCVCHSSRVLSFGVSDMHCHAISCHRICFVFENVQLLVMPCHVVQSDENAMMEQQAHQS